MKTAIAVVGAALIWIALMITGSAVAWWFGRWCARLIGIE